MRFALVTMETPESRRHAKEHREEHRTRLEAWMGQQAEAGVLVGGEAFETEAVGAVTVRTDSEGRATVTEGPFADVDETLGGFVLIDVTDRDAAVRVAASWPTGETVEIRPIWHG